MIPFEEDAVVVEVVVVGEPSEQTEDSSPMAANWALVRVNTAALSDRPSTPVAVPVTG